MTDNPLNNSTPKTIEIPDMVVPEPGTFKQTKPNQPPITDPIDDGSDNKLARTWGGTRLNECAVLTFVIQRRDDPHQFEFQVQIDDEFVIGRSHPDDPGNPDVDLTTVEGQELGISRRHARFINENGVLKVVDLGSTNGTYLNGIPLDLDHPQIMRLGDQLALGNVLLYLSRIT